MDQKLPIFVIIESISEIQMWEPESYQTEDKSIMSISGSFMNACLIVVKFW